VYDAVIVGASFAGLAAARRLGHNVVILDRKPTVGAGQASSCGAPLATLQALGVADSVLQEHTALVLHTRGATTRLPLRTPFCTFEYRLLCQAMAAQVAAEIVAANVEGVSGQRVRTNRGDFEGTILVDASGWRAALASTLRPGFVDEQALFCGVETEVGMREEGLHFWVEPGGWKNLLGWVFPCGGFSRVGVGSYVGEHPLGRRLDWFLGSLGVSGGARHGGFFPSALRSPAVGHLFVTGDAAGQCFPLSGEGIRPALYFGDACGRIARDVLDGRQSFLAGLAAYADFVARHRWPFRVMRRLQDTLLALPPLGQTLMVRMVGLRPLLRALEAGYQAAIPSQPLSAAEDQPTRSRPRGRDGAG
jgi:flavin-dependent dehydrogenase